MPEGSLIHSGLENVYWGLMIVTYPYISGLVAGSFVVSSLSHVFHQKIFDKLAPLAVLVSFALLLAAPLTVLGDARQPTNFWELLSRGHWPYSPIAFFILIWMGYIVLMLFELYFAFRAENARRAAAGDPRQRLHHILALGSRDTSEAAAARDKRILLILSSLGILMAFLFHGYIGFIFGSTKARPLWATPLMPVMFIVSAMVSGIALMWVVYVLTMRYYGRPVERPIADGLLRYLILFVLLDLYMDAVDFLTSAIPAYTQGPTAQGFQRILLHGPDAGVYLGLQIGVGLFVPLVVWVIPRLRQSWIGGAVMSVAVLIGVFAMRWDVVIAGQVQSKISQNILVAHIPWFGFDSVQTVMGVFGVAWVVFLVLAWLFPWKPWETLTEDGSPERTQQGLSPQGGESA
ncbi:MAG: polysulfide reductase NrfD [Firmicutes bacterium]|jgi:Ni/Fe-hydrogenase subunit HybB-like protein|nr:polysulfide reductase NrfD [Bacillota bacterium]MCL5971088.1 polysulfide reductase NrfD [Bacillota bacterium]